MLAVTSPMEREETHDIQTDEAPGREDQTFDVAAFQSNGSEMSAHAHEAQNYFDTEEDEEEKVADREDNSHSDKSDSEPISAQDAQAKKKANSSGSDSDEDDDLEDFDKYLDNLENDI